MEGDKVLIAHGLERAALDRVSGDPLPGPLAQAFCDADIVAGGIPIRKVVPSDWIILRGLNSPIIRLIEELRQNPNEDPKLTVSDEEHFEIIYQFTRPAKEGRQLLKQGKEVFRDKAVEWVDAQMLNPVQIQQAVAAVMEQIRRSWETALKYTQEQGKGEGTVDFKQATLQTASAGG